MKELIKGNIREQLSYSEKRKKNEYSWQNLHASDILHIHNPEKKHRKNEQSKKRVKEIKELYPAVDSLLRLEIPGPFDSTIHIMCYPEHERMFTYQLTQSIMNNAPKLEAIQEQRIKLANTFEAGNTLHEAQAKKLLVWKDASHVAVDDNDVYPF